MSNIPRISRVARDDRFPLTDIPSPLHSSLKMTFSDAAEPFPPPSLREARQGDVSISEKERMRLLRLARNDSFLANVILRHVVPKNLVPGSKNLSD